jgi:hypothetical protein
MNHPLFDYIKNPALGKGMVKLRKSSIKTKIILEYLSKSLNKSNLAP